MSLITKVRSGDLFDSLGSEEEQQESKIETKKGSTLKDVLLVFDEFVKKYNKEIPIIDAFSYDTYGEINTTLREKLRERDISKQDLRFISQTLLSRLDNADYNEYLIGLFLNSSINNCREDEITLDLDYYEVINYLGILNTKNLNLKGGNFNYLGQGMKYGIIKADIKAVFQIGHHMTGGEMTIDCPKIIGGIGYEMSGGKIAVNGIVDDSGDYMYGGEIHINGRVGKIGFGMKGGSIYVNGNYESISDNIQGGNIYHKGKQIVKDGKKVK